MNDERYYTQRDVLAPIKKQIKALTEERDALKARLEKLGLRVQDLRSRWNDYGYSQRRHHWCRSMESCVRELEVALGPQDGNP